MAVFAASWRVGPGPYARLLETQEAQRRRMGLPRPCKLYLFLAGDPRVVVMLRHNEPADKIGAGAEHVVTRIPYADRAPIIIRADVHHGIIAVDPAVAEPVGMIDPDLMVGTDCGHDRNMPAGWAGIACQDKNGAHAGRVRPIVFPCGEIPPQSRITVDVDTGSLARVRHALHRLVRRFDAGFGGQPA